MMQGHELNGRVALVTGASRNIGRAIALALAAGGASVVVNARNSLDEARNVVKEIESLGGRAPVSLADVPDQAAVGAMGRPPAHNFRPLDVLGDKLPDAV